MPSLGSTRCEHSWLLLLLCIAMTAAGRSGAIWHFLHTQDPALLLDASLSVC